MASGDPNFLAAWDTANIRYSALVQKYNQRSRVVIMTTIPAVDGLGFVFRE